MFTLVDEAFEEQLTDVQTRKRCLVLDQHPDFAGHWIIEGFSNEYLYDLGEIIGSYRALAPSGLQRFLEAAEEHQYKVAFFEDPTLTLEQFKHLNTTPEVEINSSFEYTVNGMLSFQVQGYNMLKDLPYGVVRWDTGVGKTVFASAITKYHARRESFDLAFFVVKKHNKINTVRKLKRLVGLDALCIQGPKWVQAKDGSRQPGRRERLYRQISERLEMGERGIIVVLNYETFKHDFVERDKEKKLQLTAWGETFFPGRDLLMIYDEMPSKLKTRTSELYKSICKCLYRTNPPQVNHQMLRPASMQAYMLSATPIENSPEDFFDCVRLLDGGRTYGTVSQFNEMYVESWNYFDDHKPATFHNLERMRLKASHFTHQANKTDPDIARYFPEVVEEPIYIDWDEKLSSLYSDVQDLASKMADTGERLPIFSLIGVLQMLCDAPEMILDSAAHREIYESDLEAWEVIGEGDEPKPEGSAVALALMEGFKKRLSNQNHPKLETLRELLLIRHPEAKVVLFTRWNKTIMPYLEQALKDWGVSYVRYDGTDRQKQVAQDEFQEGTARVFLSSDSGSDSLDLDAGNVVIDYNLPWKWTTLTQRHNRVHRPTSEHETVYYYSLIMADSVEERVLQIIEKKRGYHNELFDPAAGDISASARLTKEELMWILVGH